MEKYNPLRYAEFGDVFYTRDGRKAIFSSCDTSEMGVKFGRPFNLLVEGTDKVIPFHENGRMFEGYERPEDIMLD